MQRRDFLKSQLAAGASLATTGFLTRLAAQPADDRKPGQPRLFFPPSRIARFREQLATDAPLQSRWKRLLARADELMARKLMTQPEADAGPGATANFPVASRQIVERSFVFGLAWNVTQDERYARSLREALLHAIGFDRWNSRVMQENSPPRRSDLWTAAFSLGCGSGCDALAGFLGAVERKRIVEGLIRLAGPMRLR